MQITMKEAINQNKDFKFEGTTYTGKENGIGLNLPHIKFILENQDKMVEVEDNYWDKDGRAIREVGMAKDFYYVQADGSVDVDSWTGTDDDVNTMLLGNCFKDKESAEKELTRLKEKQQQRMK